MAKRKYKYNRDFYLRQTQRGWLRKQHLIEIKGGGCEKCGYNKCQRCLSFHHRDPKKKKFMLDLRTIGNRAWSTVLDEFSKCDLLCMNCHGEHHDQESSKDYLGYEMKMLGCQMQMCLTCGTEFKMAKSVISRGNGKYCSASCCGISRRKIDRPTKEELAKLVWDRPTVKIAEDFGVSDKAVEKWCKNLGVIKPGRGYWANKKRKMI